MNKVTLNNYRQKLLMGFSDFQLAFLFKKLRQLKKELRRKLTQNEFEKIVADNKYKHQ